MATPRDPAMPLPLNAEMHIDEKTGRTVIRTPAGGSGGGVTGFIDTPATDAQHAAFLAGKIKEKEADLAAAKQRHHDDTNTPAADAQHIELLAGQIKEREAELAASKKQHDDEVAVASRRSTEGKSVEPVATSAKP